MKYDSRDVKTPEQMLAWAIHEATEVHFDQKDKGKQPYILHPLRVMFRMETLEEKIVAVLHDVVEETGQHLYLFDFLNKKLVDSILALTREKHELYGEYIKRVSLDPLAKRVKIADLLDNLNRERIPNPTKVDFDRWEKYEKALFFLQREVDTASEISFCPRCHQPPKVRRCPLGGIEIFCSNGHKTIETELRGMDALAVEQWNNVVDYIRRNEK